MGENVLRKIKKLRHWQNVEWAVRKVQQNKN